MAVAAKVETSAFCHFIWPVNRTSGYEAGQEGCSVKCQIGNKPTRGTAGENSRSGASNAWRTGSRLDSRGAVDGPRKGQCQSHGFVEWAELGRRREYGADRRWITILKSGLLWSAHAGRQGIYFQWWNHRPRNHINQTNVGGGLGPSYSLTWVSLQGPPRSCPGNRLNLGLVDALHLLIIIHLAFSLRNKSSWFMQCMMEWPDRNIVQSSPLSCDC